MELSLLEPDVATLISRGDSLVLQVQKVDLERALGINTTTGELRGARTALKASSEVNQANLIIVFFVFVLKFAAKWRICWSTRRSRPSICQHAEEK